MAKETRTLIELSDILGVEIECHNPKCRAKVMLPIGSEFPSQDYRCFQCRADWFGASLDAQKGEPIAAAVSQINDLMRRLAQLSSKERSDIHVPIRFHVGSILQD